MGKYRAQAFPPVLVRGNFPSWVDNDWVLTQDLLMECRNAMTCNAARSGGKCPCAVSVPWTESSLKDYYIETPCFVVLADGTKHRFVRPPQIETCLFNINTLCSRRPMHLVVPPNFFVANLIAHIYLRNSLSKRFEDFGKPSDQHPHSMQKIARARSERVQELYKQENALSEKAHVNYGVDKDAPGRYDFVGFDGQPVAIEIKTNDSLLNSWQQLRLGILQQLKQRIMVLRVNLTTDEVEQILGSNHFPSVDGRFIVETAVTSSELPSLDEMQAILDYSPKDFHSRFPRE